jgi:predicted DNA-binding ribbon-helix-helix protein
MVLESFFQRQVVELAAKSKLTVYFLLTDVEVVDVEET